MKINKKLILFLGIPLALVVLVAAAWVFFYSSTVSVSVIGGGNPITFSQQIPNFGPIDTTGGGTNHGAQFDISVQENITVNVGLSEIIVDLTESICDYENDCDVYLLNNDGINPMRQYLDGDLMNLTSGLNFLTLKMECIENSCETRRNITITLQ